MHRDGFDVDDFGYSDNPAYLDHCLHMAVEKLKQDGNIPVARLLLDCPRMSIYEEGRDESFKHVTLTLHAPMSIAEKLRKPKIEVIDNGETISYEEFERRISGRGDYNLDVEFVNTYPILEAAKSAAQFVFGDRIKICNIRVLPAQQISNDWRNEEWESMKSSDVKNQGPVDQDSYPFVGLRFASKTEIKIAEALELEKVMYFPLCSCRVNDGQSRATKQPDFLIFHKGRWGILEVDGKYHEGMAAKDHDRDRLFRLHGKILIEHFTAHDCYNHPRDTVRKFLTLLETQA